MKTGKAIKCCPLCGGRIVVSVLYQCSLDYVMRRDGTIGNRCKRGKSVPMDADIAASNGYDLGVRGGEAFKTESRAIWHGKRWMKECGKTGTITAIPAIDPEPYHIIEW